MLFIKNICYRDIRQFGYVEDQLILNREVQVKQSASDNYINVLWFQYIPDFENNCLKYNPEYKFVMSKTIYDDHNAKYIYNHRKESLQIIELLLKGHKIAFFRGFIEIGGRTFNGFDESQIKALPFVLEEEGYYQISDLKKLIKILEEIKNAK